MSDEIKQLFKQTFTASKSQEIAREIVKIDEEKIIDRVSAMIGLCNSIEKKDRAKELLEVLHGSKTKGIPLRTAWRFSVKYKNRFGKTFTWGNEEINTGEIDIAFSEINVMLWNTYSEIVGGVNLGDSFGEA